MVNVWLRHAHSFHDYVINALLEFICFYDPKVTSNLVQNKLVRAFATYCIVCLVLVFNKGIGLFVDSVVC